MFLIIVKQTSVMFLLMLAGFMIRRTGLADHSGAKSLSNILLLVINPVTVLNCFMTVEYDAALMRGFRLTFLFAVLVHAAGIILAHFLLPGTDGDTMLERYNAVYSNCGFIGIPMVQSMLGAEGVFYLTAYIVVFNILTWTHGLIIISGDMSLKQLAKGLRSPMMLSIITGFVLFMLRVRLPFPVQGTLDYIAPMNTPIGMFVAGIALAETTSFRKLLRRQTWIVSVVKLLLIPVLTIFALRIFRTQEAVAYTIIAAAASPAATTGTMLAMRYDRDYQHSSGLYVVTTLFSMITIPAVIFIAEHIL